MEKDRTILDFKEKLASKIDINLLEIVDNWEADLCAIGFQKEDKLVYISTFNSVNKKPIKYDYDFELVDESKNEKYVVVKEGRGITEKEMINELRNYLQV